MNLKTEIIRIFHLAFILRASNAISLNQRNAIAKSHLQAQISVKTKSEKKVRRKILSNLVAKSCIFFCSLSRISVVGVAFLSATQHRRIKVFKSLNSSINLFSLRHTKTLFLFIINHSLPTLITVCVCLDI